jgi:hypothetical protein
MDSLIRKACELGAKNAPCSAEVILNAARWMERNYHDVPNDKIAAIIALHYLMFAFRSVAGTSPPAIEDYTARALYWRELAAGNTRRNSQVAQEQNPATNDGTRRLDIGRGHEG